MKPISSPDVIESLLPSLGYFGGSMSDCLEIDVGMDLTSVKLEIDSHAPTYLNLRGIEFWGDDGAIDLKEYGYRLAQSSVQKNNEGRKNEALLERKGIHSKREQAPWWEIHFNQAVSVRKIRIWNRADGWGSRSRHLVIKAATKESSSVDLYRVQSDQSVRRVLSTLERVAGVELTPAALLNIDTAKLVRLGLLALLARSVRLGDCEIAARDWVDLMALTGIWSTGEPTDDEWTLLAAYLIAQKRESPGFGTSMKTMSLLLNSRARLKRLEVELNKIGSLNALGTLMLSRHGVRSEGVLRKRSAAYVAHLREVIGVLERSDYEVVLAYGTLLGAVREGRFLAHDDDIDIMFLANATSRRGVEAEVVALRSQMMAAGLRATDLLPKHLNMHVLSRKGGLVIDIFPCWLEDGRLQMHMEGMAIRGISPDVMFPASSVQLEGQNFPAPANPEQFLQERYGDGWKIPDPYHDWPWKLQPD